MLEGEMHTEINTFSWGTGPDLWATLHTAAVA